MPKTFSKDKSSQDMSTVVSILRDKTQEVKSRIQQTHPDVYRWLEQNNFDIGQIRSHSKQQASRYLNTKTDESEEVKSLPVGYVRTKSWSDGGLVELFDSVKLPFNDHLDGESEVKLQSFIKDRYNIDATPRLERHSLPFSVGYVSRQPHFKRFPGDDIQLHDDDQEAGITHILGRWGYLTHNKDGFNKIDYLREKYSISIPLINPAYNDGRDDGCDWYRYRHVIAINPQNGQVIVGSIVDMTNQPPAEQTIKGSPELIKYLQGDQTSSLGKIVLWFIDDTKKLIPLGPIV